MVTPTTRIDASHRIDGALHASEAVSLYGHLVGEVISDDVFVIEAAAVVEGDVHAAQVVVHGTVVGTVEGTESVTISATGQVAGDIKTKAFELVAGGRVRGQVESAETVARRQAGRGRAGARSSSATNRSRASSAARSGPATRSMKPTPKPKPKPKRSNKAKASKAASKRSKRARQEEVELAPEIVEIDDVQETVTS
ncbi:MAG: hypothetical protein CL940_10230 [Deltaproteobacteria bacterium]|nr:hypothetical protein [Deltaproteobacteria bacterium]